MYAFGIGDFCLKKRFLIAYLIIVCYTIIDLNMNRVAPLYLIDGNRFVRIA